MAQLKNTTINDTGFLQLSSGTTAQRPAGAQQGQMRYNTTLGHVEWYDGTYAAWFPAGVVSPVATGGTVTNISQGGVGYRVHTFTSSGTFTVTRAGQVEFLIVAGGGGGGSRGTIQAGGGGGAGGLLAGFTSVTPQAYNITIGEGAQAGQVSPWDGSNGQNSSAFGQTSIGGGGGGGQQDRSGLSGGSGGGRASGGGAGGPGNGTPGQGNVGGSSNNPGGANQSPYNASAGGGAGVPGGNSTLVDVPPSGGTGVTSIITGSVSSYGGGGGAGQRNLNTGTGFGGFGGGGNGGVRGGTVAQAGLPNTGGGGGGGLATDGASNNGGAGGSGIVIVRYRTS